MNKLRFFMLYICIIFVSSSCVNARFDKPIGSFQKSINESAGVIAKYYDDLNSYERRLYLESVVINPRQEILFIDQHGEATPLAGRTFSTKSIKARMDALSLISVYAKRLAELAGSDAPTKFSENTKVLGENLSKLSDTFISLTGSDATASSYVGPISTLVGLVGQIYLEQRRDAALTKAITDGDPVVRAILQLLESDLVNAVDPLRKTGEKQLLAELVNNYNENRMRINQSERRQAIDKINATAESYSKAIIFNPSGLVAAMTEAYQALVKYAKSPKNPSDFAELVSALETFAARVDTIAGAIHKLQEI